MATLFIASIITIHYLFRIFRVSDSLLRSVRYDRLKKYTEEGMRTDSFIL